ncbi:MULTISPECIES: hypothetical protein [Pseudomonadati]|jgi:hypothetical protein|uniref:Uncharacterized protein n=1 Tax=Shewanella aestuarii TaxID=1028752 RepID=A0ABT0L199_9GAMM|nr:hypothetical protein [Shewanella aestuarii]MCL1117394.1 hypothetical protein [Shewanella aestuarii]GGN76133.1 hypothetical protein GCM10009193_17210 [Shewanella aestuarii]
MFVMGLSNDVTESTQATIQKGAFRAEGTLWIEDEQLHFEPFNPDLNYGPYAIELDNIKSVAMCWSRGTGLIPIEADSIQVITFDSQKFRFILASPQVWHEIISSTLAPTTSLKSSPKPPSKRVEK